MRDSDNPQSTGRFTDNPLSSTFENRDTPGPRQLSGYSYVSAWMKGEVKRKMSKIQIAKPHLCGHVNRICVNCAHQWTDYEIMWERTVGGRALKQAINEQNENKAKS